MCKSETDKEKSHIQEKKKKNNNTSKKEGYRPPPPILDICQKSWDVRKSKLLPLQGWLHVVWHHTTKVMLMGVKNNVPVSAEKLKQIFGSS